VPSLSAALSVYLIHLNTTTVLGDLSTMCDLLDRAIIVDVDVQSLGLVVHRAHAVRLEDAVLLGEVVLREGLW
jgi:hypothetical protein